jgi:hypothetical protein
MWRHYVCRVFSKKVSVTRPIKLKDSSTSVLEGRPIFRDAILTLHDASLLRLGKVWRVHGNFHRYRLLRLNFTSSSSPSLPRTPLQPRSRRTLSLHIPPPREASCTICWKPFRRNCFCGPAPPSWWLRHSTLALSVFLVSEGYAQDYPTVHKGLSDQNDGSPIRQSIACQPALWDTGSAS